MRLCLCGLFIVLGLYAVLGSAPALAIAGKAPVIVSMSAGVGGEVTVGATINPEGLQTTYEITLEANGQRAAGQLPAVNEDREVILTVTGLQPGTYWFSVHAVNAAGEAYQRTDILKIPPIPPGACPAECSTTEPYKSEISQGDIESANAEAAQTVKEYEERKQQLAKEQEEKQAKEKAAALAAEQAALERGSEEEARKAAPAPACIVPSLKGKTLSIARRALRRAHCRLGKIGGRHRHRAMLRIVGQSQRPGTKLKTGAAVYVTLGPVRSRRQRG